MRPSGKLKRFMSNADYQVSKRLHKNFVDSLLTQGGSVADEQC